MRLVGTLLTGLAVLSRLCCPQPVLTVGLQGILGSQYNSTFGAFLTNSTPYQFATVTYDNDSRMLADAVAGRLNMTFAGPVQYLCLALAASTSDGVAELVSASYVDGAPVERLAGAIVTLAASGVNTVNDLRGRTVLTGSVASLTTFAAQWQLLQTKNFSLFSDTRGVFLQPNVTRLLPDLLAGVGDAVFVPSSYLERYYPGSTAFRVLNRMDSPGFPYLHSTALFPNAVLSALDTTAFDVRRGVAQALFDIRPDAQVAQGGQYYGFTPLGAYTQIRTLMAAVGLLNNATQCRTITELADLIQCPPGFTRQPSPAASCQSKGVACPDGYQCVCNPCAPVVVTLRLLGLGVTGFALVIAAVAVAAGVTAFVALRVCWLRGRHDPWRELCLDGARVVGQSSNGPVFATDWRGQQVAVKRLFPPPAGVASVFDQHPSQSCFTAQAAWRLLLRCFWLSTAETRELERVERRMHLHHGSLMPVLGWSRGASGREVVAIMPLMHRGTVSDLIATRHALDDYELASMAMDVVNAAIFLHGCRPPVVGINLKPHHLFLDDSLRTLVGVSFRPPNMRSVWAPPECLRGDTGLTPASDVYGFSMLLYSLVQQRAPFEGRKSCELLTVIEQADEDTVGDARPELRRASLFNPLIEACWAQRPADRPSFHEVRTRLSLLASAFGPRSSLTIQPARQKLLGGMFPEHVRQLLEEGRPAPTDEYPCVTVFFSDIVGFTAISTVLQPSALKDMLNELWSFMDETANELGVHKLETAGDALLAVTNVMQRQEDHAPRMALFALRVLAGVRSIPVNPAVRDGPCLQLRVGIHSGPVVGGVVGINNLRYCLYGLTMSVASRMESTGEPGRIQLTERAAALVASDPELARRIVPRPGMTDVKGQGPTKTCWLLTDAQPRGKASPDGG